MGGLKSPLPRVEHRYSALFLYAVPPFMSTAVGVGSISRELLDGASIVLYNVHTFRHTPRLAVFHVKKEREGSGRGKPKRRSLICSIPKRLD